MTTKTLSLITATLLLSTNAFADTTLEDITVVSATRTTQNIQNVTSDVDVLTAQEIEDRGYTTVAQALSSVAGISVVSNGGLGKSTSVYLRGMDNQRTLILIDGMRYQDPSNTSGASLENLMTSDIERIEIIKGAQSGIWGADAAAGVINIITKSSQKGLHGSAHAEAGSFKTKKYGASLSNKTENYHFSLSANKITSDGFTAQAPRYDDIKQYEDDAYNNLTLKAKLGVTLWENAELSLEHMYIDGSNDYDSSGANDTMPLTDFTTRLTKADLKYTLNHHLIHLKYEISDFNRKELGVVPSPWYAQVTQFNGKIKNLELTDKIDYFENDFMLIGMNDRKTDVDYVAVQTGTTTNNKNYANRGIFLVNTNHFFNNTIVTESLRYDHYDAFDNKVTGKIGVKYTTDFGLKLRGNYGTAYNAPNLIQSMNPWGGSNADLHPETVKSYDLSVAHFGMKITYFHQNIDDMITWYDPDGYLGPLPGIFKNYIGTSKINGIEVSYQKEIFDGLFTRTNYTKLTKYKDNQGQTLERRAKETFNLALDYYGIDKLHIGAEAQYIGERYKNANKQGQQTGKYTVFNMTADYQITDDIQVYGKIENLGDKYYQTVDGYATSPRAFYAGVRAKF